MLVSATHPTGYDTRLVTLDQLRLIHEPKMHPEFARRLFAWLATRPDVGIGGGWRSTQPTKPGFAPDGKSFHQSQTFASGFVGYAAVDLVVAVPGKVHRSPTWAETADAPVFGLHTFIKVPPEPWHLQAVEMRGWQTWVDGGRKDPPKIPLPDDDDEEVEMLEYVLVPKHADAEPWWPWLACYSTGTVRPLGPGGPKVPHLDVTDLGQYRRICAAAGIQLVDQFP